MGEQTVKQVSPIRKQLSRAFLAPSFTSPANKINLVEIKTGQHYTKPSTNEAGSSSPKSSLMSGVLGTEGLMSSGSKNLF